MNLTNFNSLFEVIAGLFIAMMTGYGFRNSLMNTLQDTFNRYTHLDNRVDIQVIEEFREMSILLRTKTQNWKIRSKIKFRLLKLCYKYFVPNPEIKKKPDLSYYRDLLDRVGQSTIFNALGCCITIIILNAWLYQSDKAVLPFSNYVFGKVIYFVPEEFVVYYIYLSILFSVAVAIQFGLDRKNSYFYRSEKMILAITIRGLLSIALKFVFIILLAIFLSVSFGNQIKNMFVNPIVLVICICFLPLLIIAFAYQYILLRLRMWFFKVRMHTMFCLYFQKLFFNERLVNLGIKRPKNCITIEEDCEDMIIANYDYLLEQYRRLIDAKVEELKRK